MIPLSIFLCQEVDSSKICDSIKDILRKEVDEDMSNSIMNTYTSRKIKGGHK